MKRNKKGQFVKGQRANPITEFKKGYISLRRGIRLSEEIKEKISSGKRGKPNFHLRGKKSHFWQGGVSFINRTTRQIFMSTLEYRQWRRKVFERDNYTCVICGQKGKGLHADHIKPYLWYPELRLDLRNGRTICIFCHRKTDTWGNKVYSYA